MGMLFVVGDQPGIGQLLNLIDRIEQTGIEHFRPEAAIEALDEGVLIGLAGLDEHQPDVAFPGTAHEDMRGHLWTVVQPDGLGPAVDFHQLLHHLHQSQGRHGAAALDAQPLAVTLVDDVERAKRPTVVERVTHEIQRPDPVECPQGLQRLGIACQHPFAGSAGQVQLHAAVHAMDALVVPAVAQGAQPVKALPESPAAMAAEHTIERLDDWSVPDGRLFCPGPVQSRPRYPRDPAGPALGQVMLIDHHLNGIELGSWLYHFRDSTSLMAAFSSARSAYMRLRRAFSASSSLTLFSSETVM